MISAGASKAELLGSRLLRARLAQSRPTSRRLCAEHRSGRRDNSLYIWTLFNLTAWYNYWIDRPRPYGRRGMSAWGLRALRLLKKPPGY